MPLYGGVISWQCKLEKCVALSTIEAKYIIVIEVSKEMVWIKKYISEVYLDKLNYVIFCDSQSAIDLS